MADRSALAEPRSGGIEAPVAEEQSNEKLTRRAQRRAERVRQEAAGSEDERGTEERGAEASEAASGSEGRLSAPEGGEERKAKAAAAKPKANKPKAKKKPKKAQSTQDIRERNREMREEAAKRRRSQRKREQAAAAAQGLEAGEIVEDALARYAHAATSFVRRNFALVQWVAVLVVVGGFGYLIWSYRHEKSVASASDALMNGVRIQRSPVAAETALGGPDTGFIDSRTVYETGEERIKSAAAEYRKVIDGSSPATETTRTLAKLGLSGLLLDQGKTAEAKALYEEVRDSELAKKDPDVRLRSIEGIGLALEAKGDHDAALKAFKELENSDVSGFVPLGQYHQARILYLKKETEKAKELLKKAYEKVSKDRQLGEPPSYLEGVTRELLQTIDPEAVPAPSTSGITPEQLERLQKQIEEVTQKAQDAQKNKAPLDADPEPTGGSETDPSGAADEPAEPGDTEAEPKQGASEKAAPQQGTNAEPKTKAPAPKAPTPKVPVKPAPTGAPAPTDPGSTPAPPPQPQTSEPAPAGEAPASPKNGASE